MPSDGMPTDRPPHGTSGGPDLGERWAVPLEALVASDVPRAGGKAVSLGALQRAGIDVPAGVCVLTTAYEHAVTAGGLDSIIALELARKRFEDMRWEEIWDVSLRIRNAFMRTPLPTELTATLTRLITARFGDRPVVVRSSARGEDAEGTSFAGLHESVVNVAGPAAVLDALRRVWASLWSDRALLYRQELALEVESSTIAVVIQELIAGECSGVAFSRSPTDADNVVVEAVWGLNQGLVDGTVEPDRFILDRTTGRLLEHVAPDRPAAMFPAACAACGHEVVLEKLDPERSASPPLSPGALAEVAALARRAEEVFGPPQDVEWTFKAGRLYALQARPVTTMRGDAAPREGDQRGWYLSLTRSFENLQALRRQIEDVSIPAMMSDAEGLARVDLAALTDRALLQEIERRTALRDHWTGVYWQEFIPFAHGMRLFGQVYTDVVRPEDPYEFLDLLAGGGLLSVERNDLLGRLAHELRSTGDVADAELDAFLDRFGGGPGTHGDARRREREGLRRLLERLAERAGGPDDAPRQDPQERARRYLDRFAGDERLFQEQLLDLARASYRLRDDDNLHLDRVEAGLRAALDEGRRRLARDGLRLPDTPLDAAAIIKALEDPTAPFALPKSTGETGDLPETSPREAGFTVRARQLVGQPAGPGLAVGPARVIREATELLDFREGEVLVCDALDPTMTFVVPLASAVVERRGGMLIHGAIIAREYGLPCVTGVPQATESIHTGDTLTVDGYLGVVVIGGTPAEGADDD